MLFKQALRTAALTFACIAFPLIGHSQLNLNGDTATLIWGAIDTPPSSWTSAPSLLPFITGGNPPFTNVFGPTQIGAATPTFPDPDMDLDVNVSGNTVTISTYPFVNSGFGSYPFSGCLLTDLSEPIPSATLSASSLPGFTASDVGIIDGDLWVNLEGLTLAGVAGGEQIDITLAPVPEPSTWALLLIGSGALVFVALEPSRAVNQFKK